MCRTIFIPAASRCQRLVRLDFYDACLFLSLQDAENKKSEKKEVAGPPLQTASVSVRALIEEKIIQKRTTGKELSVLLSFSLSFFCNDAR